MDDKKAGGGLKGSRLNDRKVFILPVFLTGCAIIIFYFLMKNISVVGDAVSKLNSTLAPFFYGLLIADLLSPFYNWVVKKFYARSSAKGNDKVKSLRNARIIASILSMLLFILIIAAFIVLFMPQIIKSIISFANILPKRITQLNDWISSEQDSSLGKGSKLAGYVSAVVDYLEKWIRNRFVPSVGNIIDTISQKLIVTLRTIFNIFIGIIVSVYFLNDKDRIIAWAKKTTRALCNDEHTAAVYEFGAFVNKTFGGFIIGKIIDSIIIGFMCTGIMQLMHLPYPILIGAIIGITNVIPFFGPFIGAIPSSIIICVVNPLQALYFLIMIFLLQQFDGNILGPKILGDSTGLDSFLVMFAIIVAGGLFGFVGMILGVPVFAVIYFYFRKFVRNGLEKRGEATDTASYINMDEYDIAREDAEAIERETSQRKSRKKSIPGMIKGNKGKKQDKEKEKKQDKDKEKKPDGEPDEEPVKDRNKNKNEENK
ncbi:MAG: AI-2E family transporter [Anaerovoracaceae bacterium]